MTPLFSILSVTFSTPFLVCFCLLCFSQLPRNTTQNIDLEGHVCLNILRESWSPALNLTSIAFGLLFLFHAPNADDPLNKEAAEFMQNHPAEFERAVRATLRGGFFYGKQFKRLI